MNRELPINPFSRPGEPLDYVWGIVWHWVGNAGKGKDHTARYFELLANQDNNDDKEDRYASAHYIVDEEGYLKVIPVNEVAYHAGSRWWNHHSIGIEICHPDWSGRFQDGTLKNLYELTAFLMRVFGIENTTRIKRHYDITGKLCPKWFVEHPEDFNLAKRKVEALL